jgi:hypothetical protein
MCLKYICNINELVEVSTKYKKNFNNKQLKKNNVNESYYKNIINTYNSHGNINNSKKDIFGTFLDEIY